MPTRNWPLIAQRLANEKLLTLAEAARTIPTGRGRRGHSSAQALFRWILNGKRGIYLDALRTGHGYSTSREALCRFFAEISARDIGH